MCDPKKLLANMILCNSKETVSSFCLLTSMDLYRYNCVALSFNLPEVHNQEWQALIES